MANWETTHGVRACMDCVTFSANGADGMDAATVARVLAGFNRYGSGVTFDADTSHRTGEWYEYGFTWDRCDICGLNLGHDYVRGTVSGRVA